MIKSYLHYRCLLLLIFIKIHFISGQICTNDIPDFFYNVSFAGPLFDQPVYTIPSNFSISTPVNTSVFVFIVRPRTIYDRPSFISTNFTDRILNSTSAKINVTSSHPSFTVVESANLTYRLITNTSPLNYFSPYNRYLFQLIAKQSFDDRPSAISTAIVQINLQNANIHRPIFISDNQTFYISETAENGTQFGTVYASDADNDIIIYSITSAQFSIGPLTGVLQLKQPFGSSSPTEQYVNVILSDNNPTCLSSDPLCRNSTESSIRIIITAVNKNSPRFLNQICGQNITFYENNTINQDIESLVVFDDDRGENGQITISFPSEQLRTTVSGLRNTAYSQFYIEQLNQTNSTRTAILKTNRTFDYDTAGATRVWYLFVLATDNGKPHRQTFCSLRISLLDLNDNAPVFIMTSWNYTIYNSTINTNTNRFLRIIASDADSGSNGMIDYYIGTLNVPYFAINRTTGAITLRSDISGIASLNISLFPITFYVYAQDRGTPSLLSKNNATVTIYYRNSNDLAPARWLDTSYEDLHISIREKFYERYANQAIFEENQSGFNGSIFYRLTSNTSSIMTVYSPFFDNTHLPFRDRPVVKEGDIFRSGIGVTSGLHAEFQDVYLLCIRVLVNPPLIGSVTIRIKDENDQIPTFDIRSMVLSVVEKEQGQRTIAQIQAFDRDVDYENNYVEYRLNSYLSDTEINGIFHVESNGTIWTNTTFGENTKTLYRLFITAYNVIPAWDLVTNNTQDFQFDIQVISINENPPIFTNGSLINVSIDERTVNGADILNLTIVDPDIDTNLNLGILSGNLRNAFTFTLLSNNSDDSTRTQYEAIGQLKVVAPLDYESTSVYTLILFAFDSKNIANISVTVVLIPQNTKAPYFQFTSYQYRVTEEETRPVLDGPNISAIDPDRPESPLHYEIYDTNHQLNLNNLVLNQTGNGITLGIKSPGLSRDFPFGHPLYSFAIRVTDQNGAGVSSYAPVTIEVMDKNNKAPIPTNFPWYINDGVNSPIQIIFQDYDDPVQNNTTPYTVAIVGPSNFIPIGPTLSGNGSFDFVYNGILNCSLTKNLNVTFNASDNKGLYSITTIPIIVRGNSSSYPIYDGYKTIKIIYVNGYQNSLRNINLGSIYVNDLYDCVRDNRIYPERLINNGQTFITAPGFLSTPEALNPGSSTIRVNVTKPNISSAWSIINLEVESIDSEYVRQASTIRIQGEYPKTLIDPELGYPLNKLLTALASILSVPIGSIKILSIRSVFQYRSPYYPPESFEVDKSKTLTDVIFYVPPLDTYDIENKLYQNLDQFESQFNIKANASGPNPCNNYVCPINTTCRATRTIHPKPSTIDTDQASFIGINILDSADCVNSVYTVNLTSISTGCEIATFNGLPYCSSRSSLPYGPIGPCCEILGRTFDENGGGYARYAGATFANFPPARFSFDFALRSFISDGLILLYGRNSPPIDDFFWIAIEIYQSKLRFHFRDIIIDATNTELNASIWYHVECQFIDSIVLVTVNDCQYNQTINETLNTYDLSTVELYLGGLPTTNSLLSALYPLLTSVDIFNGCIRNVLSNGFYLDMSKNISSANSNNGECPCLVTNSCIATRLMTNIIPWYTWLIIALVLLLLATIFTIALLTIIRQKEQLKSLAGLYTDDTGDNIMDYKETAGEQDHSAYNLRVLKKPVYALTNGSIMSSYRDPRIYHPPPLDDYIEEKLGEQVLFPANDTRLHYQYEGVGSIAADLSSIESLSSQNENDYKFLHSLGPKFSGLADLYVDHNNDDV